MCAWVLGLKGLIKSAKKSLYSRGLRNGDEGRKEKILPRMSSSHARVALVSLLYVDCALIITNYTRSNEFIN